MSTQPWGHSSVPDVECELSGGLNGIARPYPLPLGAQGGAKVRHGRSKPHREEQGEGPPHGGHPRPEAETEDRRGTVGTEAPGNEGQERTGTNQQLEEEGSEETTG